MYGGLWAGATWLISSIAASTSGVTRCTPLIRPPCTALKPIAETSPASFRQPVCRIGQLLQALPHRHRMIGHLRRQLLPLAADLDEAAAFRRADPFDAAARKLPLVGHIEQPILEARRAEVGDEDLHD